MDVTVLQTCDKSEYLPMLEATSRTAREFCRRHGLAYRNFVGVKRGLWSWHSTYNRIYMIKELIDEGNTGWILYLDADAYVYDLDFAIAGYLAAHAQQAGIFVRVSGVAPYWDVNAGVFLLNAGHPLTQRLVENWISGHEQSFRRPEFLLDEWPHLDLHIEDQGILNEMLIANPDWQHSLHYESLALMNSMQASFLRHHLRAATPDLAQRIKAIQQEVDEVMAKGAAGNMVPPQPMRRASVLAQLRGFWRARNASP